MIFVSEELKRAFSSAEQKNLVLTFDDGTIIDNNDIALESMGLEQTLCDSDELRFGKIASACFKTKIKASEKRYKNLWFNARIGVREHSIELGKFKVYSDNMTSDRLYRDIVAYDTLFWVINTNVTEWFNGLTFPITQKEFRDSLFDYLGIEQEVVELPNDSITFNRTINAENLTGLTVLQKLCEINATWGTINNVGKFKYTRIRTHKNDALYPSDELFPSEELFPDDIYEDALSKASYYQGTLKYEEYNTQPITKVTIREDSDDLGYSYGTDGNTYVIENNFLLYGASDSTLDTVAKNFFDYAQYIAYTPSQLKCKGAPWREVGDLLLVETDKRTLTIPILNRQLSGITALKDTYTAKGTETYGEVKNSSTEQLKQLQGRTNKLVRDLNGTRSEVAKKVNGEDVVSVINQSADTIELIGDRIIVDSTKWKVNENGSQECSDLTITGGNVNLESNTTAQTKLRVAFSNYESSIFAGNISTNSDSGTVRLFADGYMIINANYGTGGNVFYIADHRCTIGSNEVVIANSFLVKGTKSRVADTETYGNRLLYCYETPSPMFGDIGEGKIDETGKCYIFLDDIFCETIDTDCMYQVFLQPYGKGECYVTERTSSYFIVEGTENLAFGWELKAIQRDFDTMRLEEHQEIEQEETNVLSETYGYLTTLLYNPETEEIENE